MLSNAFNYLLALHGKACTYKMKGKTGWTDYTIKVAPSNYSRKNEIVSDMTIQGREYVIPLASIKASGMNRIPEKGDIIIFEGRNESIIEVSPMADLGGSAMGFRVRVG